MTQRIVVSSDHAGWQLKSQLKPFLGCLGYEVQDVGVFTPEPPVDYPEYTLKAAEKVASGEFERGIIFCGTGQGDAMVANRVPGVRAALCWDVFTARLSREHNDANMLVLGGWTTDAGLAEEMVRVWLTTLFAGGRHQRRLNLITSIEKDILMRRRRLYDISLTIRPGMPVWPGDPEVVFEESLSPGVARLTRLSLSAHTGSHVDAPAHFIPGGAGIDSIALDALLGPARLFQLPQAGAIDRCLLESLPLEGVSRLLLGTRNSVLYKDDKFSRDYVSLTADAAEYLVEKGIRLLALDYLSVDSFNAKSYPVHHALLKAGVAIVEGVDLSGVPAGDYELLCLPIKIKGGDGAPARVVLREV